MSWLDLGAEAERWRVEIPEAAPMSELEAALVENTWRGRMLNEHASARVFGALLGQAMRAGVSAARQETLARFALEELNHAQRCAGVLLSLGLEPRGELPELPPVPEHADVEPMEAFLRNVLSVCCLSETCASALVAAERLALRDNPLAEVLERILADEIGHARFGWKLLEDTPRSDELNERLSDYLQVAFRHLEAYELAHLSPVAAPAAAAARGACDGAAARDVFYDTVEGIIVPRLEQHGLQADRAWKARLSSPGAPPAARDSSPTLAIPA